MCEEDRFSTFEALRALVNDGAIAHPNSKGALLE
jgi:hypothetical protein